MEFMSVGVPVVISSTKVDRYYFNDSVVRFFESGNVESLAKEITDLLKNRDSRKQLIDRALEYARQNCWENRKRDYLQLVDNLIARRTETPNNGTDANGKQATLDQSLSEPPSRASKKPELETVSAKGFAAPTNPQPSRN